ncbi:linoleoyl-CoA desaturase domain protein [Mycobacterium xenopi 4042]|uniref:Linoleoyl-CoA desaturase domain protein n=1 Tax=Mycobacterium xenopi 4042 TaxID=1299334 RepID=X7YVN4_MYCXE|nr:linoleoyl-CoA desaturase domain protein [Mycobacterium xenopi 4042]
MSQPTITLTPDQAEALGRELDAIKERVMADLGERDAAYIRRVIKAQRVLEIGGRAVLFAGIVPPAWLAGTAMLALSKILDNMEIGHNVMHGQYDWMRDPSISGRSFEWDTACPQINGGTHTTTCTTPTPTSLGWTGISATASCE